MSAGPSIPSANNSAPAPAGPPSLCEDSARLCAPKARRSVGDAPGRLHRIHMKPRAMVAAQRRGSGDRLDRPGLVVGQHEAHQRRAARQRRL